MASKLMYKFVGDGSEFLYGVPCKNFTEEEFEQLDETGKVLVETNSQLEPAERRLFERVGKPKSDSVEVAAKPDKPSDKKASPGATPASGEGGEK